MITARPRLALGLALLGALAAVAIIAISTRTGFSAARPASFYHGGARPSSFYHGAGDYFLYFRSFYHG